MTILYLRGEIQHVVARIIKDELGNGFTFVLVLRTRSVLAILEPFLCLAGPVSPPQPQVGTRNCLFQCRLGATRRLRLRGGKKLRSKKDTLTDQHQEHHDILNMIHDITNQKPPKVTAGNKYRREEASQGPISLRRVAFPSQPWRPQQPAWPRPALIGSTLILRQHPWALRLQLRRPPLFFAAAALGSRSIQRRAAEGLRLRGEDGLVEMEHGVFLALWAVFPLEFSRDPSFVTFGGWLPASGYPHLEPVPSSPLSVVPE
jgi:hypothetical protein